MILAAFSGKEFKPLWNLALGSLRLSAIKCFDHHYIISYNLYDLSSETNLKRQNIRSRARSEKNTIELRLGCIMAIG